MSSPCARYAIRELTRSDVMACVEFYDGLEPRDRRQRFAYGQFSLASFLPSERPEKNGAALGAFGYVDRLLGVVNLEYLEDGDAEVAIIVRSDFQRRGTGFCLMSRAIETAAVARLKRLVAYVSPENFAANALVKKCGFRVVELDRYFAEVALLLS